MRGMPPCRQQRAGCSCANNKIPWVLQRVLSYGAPTEATRWMTRASCRLVPSATRSPGTCPSCCSSDCVCTASESIAVSAALQGQVLLPPSPLAAHPPTHLPPCTQLRLTKVEDEDDVAGTIAELVSVLPLKTLRENETAG